MAELANWPRARKPTTTPTIRAAATAMAARAKSILTCLPPGLMMRPEVRVLELKRLRTPASCPLLEQGRVDAALSMIRTGVVAGTWTGDGVFVSTASLRRAQKPVMERCTFGLDRSRHGVPGVAASAGAGASTQSSPGHRLRPCRSVLPPSGRSCPDKSPGRTRYEPAGRRRAVGGVAGPPHARARHGSSVRVFPRRVRPDYQFRRCHRPETRRAGRPAALR